jgi:hypothetical protein
LRIVGRSSKSIANVIDPTMIPLNDFIPCDRVAGNAATDQQSSHLGVFQDLLPGNRVRIGTLSFQPLAFSYQESKLLVQLFFKIPLDDCTCAFFLTADG